MYNNIMSQKVLDSWEDWDDSESSDKTLNKQQHKILEERKLMEDADNELTENLFSVTQENTTDTELKKSLKTTERSKEKPEKPEKNKESTNKIQKNLSIKIKNRNQTQKKQNEIFGKCDDNTYVKYCEIEEKYLD